MDFLLNVGFMLNPSFRILLDICSHYIRKRSNLWIASFLLERAMGIGPTLPAWEAGALPLSYARKSSCGLHFCYLNDALLQSCNFNITVLQLFNYRRSLRVLSMSKSQPALISGVLSATTLKSIL